MKESAKIWQIKSWIFFEKLNFWKLKKLQVYDWKSL